MEWMAKFGNSSGYGTLALWGHLEIRDCVCMCHLKIQLCSWKAPTLDVTTAEHNTVERKHCLPPAFGEKYHQTTVTGHVFIAKTLSSVVKVLWFPEHHILWKWYLGHHYGLEEHRTADIETIGLSRIYIGRWQGEGGLELVNVWVFNGCCNKFTTKLVA